MAWKTLSNVPLTAPLPVRFDSNTIYQLVNQVLDENYDARSSEIHFDFSTLGFIEPTGVTVLSNLIQYLMRCGARTFFNNHTSQSAPLKYLDDAGFFHHYLGSSVAARAVVRNTTFPLEHVAYAASYGFMDNRLVPWLGRALNADTRHLATLKVCFQEIYNNINDHSQVNIGCTFAQHYPNLNRVKISVSDFGVGIAYNVRRFEPHLADHQAINRAFDRGFTTQTTPGNRGAGLDVLVQNVVARNGGWVMVRSNRGIVSCSGDGFGNVARSPASAPGFYPGTLIQVTLNTQTFQRDPIDEEVRFEW